MANLHGVLQLVHLRLHQRPHLGLYACGEQRDTDGPTLHEDGDVPDYPDYVLEGHRQYVLTNAGEWATIPFDPMR